MRPIPGPLSGVSYAATRGGHPWAANWFAGSSVRNESGQVSCHSTLGMGAPAAGDVR